jgi:hypothetical protein
VADLVWEATPVSAGEGRTVAELLDDSDGLAPEVLLDMSADRARLSATDIAPLGVFSQLRPPSLC